LRFTSRDRVLDCTQASRRIGGGLHGPAAKNPFISERREPRSRPNLKYVPAMTFRPDMARQGQVLSPPPPPAFPPHRLAGLVRKGFSMTCARPLKQLISIVKLCDVAMRIQGRVFGPPARSRRVTRCYFTGFVTTRYCRGLLVKSRVRAFSYNEGLRSLRWKRLALDGRLC